MTTNAFPELISRTVQAEARNGRNLSLLTHVVGLNTRWFITQKWYLDAPLPRRRVLQTVEETSTAPDLWNRKDCTKLKEFGVHFNPQE